MPPEPTTPGTGQFPADLRVAVLGGTGPQGRGLARRFAAAGLDVIVGSRSAERAAGVAEELSEATGRPGAGDPPPRAPPPRPTGPGGVPGAGQAAL